MLLTISLSAHHHTTSLRIHPLIIRQHEILRLNQNGFSYYIVTRVSLLNNIVPREIHLYINLFFMFNETLIIKRRLPPSVTLYSPAGWSQTTFVQSWPYYSRRTVEATLHCPLASNSETNWQRRMDRYHYYRSSQGVVGPHDSCSQSQ